MFQTVEVFEYGSRSRAFRLLEEARSDTEHPAHLCMSCSTSKLMVDLVALNDADIERSVPNFIVPNFIVPNFVQMGIGIELFDPIFPRATIFHRSVSSNVIFVSIFGLREFGQEKTALRQEFFRKMDTKQRLPTSSSSKKIERETDRS